MEGVNFGFGPETENRFKKKKRLVAIIDRWIVLLGNSVNDVLDALWRLSPIVISLHNLLVSLAVNCPLMALALLLFCLP